MLIVKREFMVDQCAELWWTMLLHDGDRGEALCDSRLREEFDFPEDAGTIWLSLHDTPAANRHRVVVRLDECGDPVVRLSRRHDPPFDDADLYDELRPLVGKKVYVELEYEE